MKKLLSMALAKLLNRPGFVYVLGHGEIKLWHRGSAYFLLHECEDGGTWDLDYYEYEDIEPVWAKPVREDDIISFCERWTIEVGDKLV